LVVDTGNWVRPAWSIAVHARTAARIGRRPAPSGDHRGAGRAALGASPYRVTAGYRSLHGSSGVDPLRGWPNCGGWTGIPAGWFDASRPHDAVSWCTSMSRSSARSLSVLTPVHRMRHHRTNSVDRQCWPTTAPATARTPSVTPWATSRHSAVEHPPAAYL